jgi:outer membrane protein
MYNRSIVNKVILKFFLGILGVLIYSVGISQTTLTQAEAVEIMLANNYGIRIAKNNRLIAENNTSRELNGYIPTVNASAAANTNLGGSHQEFSNGMEANVENAFTWGSNASVTANYTLLDKRRSVNLEQLKELVKLSDFELRQTMELNLLQLFNAYYEVASLTENLSLQTQTMNLSRQRLLSAQYRYDYGQGIKLDVLNAEVDIQRDSINFLNIKQLLANSKRNLNVIMGRSVETGFEVDTEVRYSENLSLENLLAAVQNNNIEVQISNKNLEINNYDLQILDAERKPTLSTSASYNFSYQNNAPAAFITSSSSRGLGIGLNLAWNIFDGGVRKVRKQNVNIAIQNQQVSRQQLLEELERDVTNAWESYQNALQILEVENASLATNRLNFERTEELYKSGQLNSVEFRQAQLNLLNAAVNYNTAKYDAKVIEIQLLQLSGDILNQQF